MTIKLPPMLACYVQRIGADQLNFRSFMVRVWKDHYYIEKDIVRIGDDATVTCTNPEYAPTAEELAGLAAELPAYIASWPRSMNAEHTDALRRFLRDDCGRPKPTLFEFYDRSGDGGIIMVQERIQKPDGKKDYLPWTYWTDGLWRCMEPMHRGDRPLPFWKPKEKRELDIPQAMVHEGPKVAEYCDKLVNDPTMRDELDAHPWKEELVLYEHWGAIGGAMAPQRSDYEELRKQKFKALVYVCDNDYPGKSVAQEFSRHYRKTMKAVMFSDSWPESWDMAEKMPPKMFDKEGRFIGPTLVSLMQPATRATEQRAVNDKGKLGTFLLPDFCEEWLHSITPDVYINRSFPDKMLGPSEFNDLVRPYSHVKETSELMKGNAALKSWQVKYDPGKPGGVHDNVEEGQFINTYVGPAIRAERGDDSPWIEFMEHLLPDEGDREKVYAWCATLIARPDIRMNYGLLLISETQGVGKGTLGEKVLLPLVGKNNTSVPSEGDVVSSDYNYWLAHKRLAIVHEIYAGHSSKAYNKLKSTITDAKVMVKRKYVDEYTIDNWIHIFACSNSSRALQLTMDDRRWLVPLVTERKRDKDYWRSFNYWLAQCGGLQKIKQWAHAYVAAGGIVYGGDEAPWTTKKREIVEEGYSPGMQVIDRLLAYIEEKLDDQVIITDTSLVDVIRHALYEGRASDRLEKPLTLRKIAKARGWKVGQGRANIEAWGTRLSAARLLCRTAENAAQTAGELAEAGRKPLNVLEIWQRLSGM